MSIEESCRRLSFLCVVVECVRRTQIVVVVVVVVVVLVLVVVLVVVVVGW